MSLRSTIETVSGAGRIIDRPMEEATQLSRAINGLKARIDAVEGGLVENPPAFVERMIGFWERERDLSALQRRDVRAAARHLFTHDLQGRRIGDDARRVASLLSHPGATKSAQAVKNFAMAFLSGYEAAPPESLERLANHLANAAGKRRLESVDAWIANKVLDPRRGAQTLMARILSAGAPVAPTLEAVRIPELLYGEGIVRRAFRHACDHVRDHAADSPALIDTLIDWATQSGNSDEGAVQPRYPDKLGETVNALLLPWRGGSPVKDVERKVRNFVIAALGDPRFARSSAQWADVDNEARQVLTAWLTRASVEQFFEIVSQTMSKPDEKRMWRYRRKFWSAYVPHLTNAWVAFGSQGEYLARETARRTGDSSFRQFGRLNGSVAGTHAVLIMTIGDLTIAEWSHNGKCRMWPRGHRGAPKLYTGDYRADDLRWSDWWETSHTGNETYGWQRKFADQIRRFTGVSVSAIEYRVR